MISSPLIPEHLPYLFLPWFIHFVSSPFISHCQESLAFKKQSRHLGKKKEKPSCFTLYHVLQSYMKPRELVHSFLYVHAYVLISITRLQLNFEDRLRAVLSWLPPLLPLSHAFQSLCSVPSTLPPSLSVRSCVRVNFCHILKQSHMLGLLFPFLHPFKCLLCVFFMYSRNC